VRHLGFVSLGLVLLAACGGDDRCGDGATCPFGNPTHHAEVRGRVTDTAGRPLGGLAVEVSLVAELDGQTSVGRWGPVLTRADGQYAVSVDNIGFPGAAPRPDTASGYVVAAGADDPSLSSLTPLDSVPARVVLGPLAERPPVTTVDLTLTAP
jgi:hypothetical protein